MTTLEKAKCIVETGSCSSFRCGEGDIDLCPCVEGCGVTMGGTGSLDEAHIQQARDYIAKETKVEAIAPGTKVYVSDVTDLPALKERKISLYVCISPSGRGHYCTEYGEENSQDFKKGFNNVNITHWNYVIPYTDKSAKEMTIEDIQNELGYKVKIVEAL